MKKVACYIITIFVMVFSLSVVGCGFNKNDDILRIHIRANSNSVIDQEIKMQVRDKLVKYISTCIENCNTCDDVVKTLSASICNIESLSDSVLIDNGFDYLSSASIRTEHFPTRSYDGVSFPAGEYRALIVELGDGVGDNWWCVAYPPLCFVGEETSDNGVRYRSKIIEILRSYF